MPIDPDRIPWSWARRELRFPGDLTRGRSGRAVQSLQEWLHLHGFSTPVDGKFGAATEDALAAFRAATGLRRGETLDERCWDKLVAPMARALAPVPKRGRDFPALMLATAQQHLTQHPREVGGENAGPWVRLYCGGHDGPDFLWCAGFVSFLMRQASHAAGHDVPIEGHLSCDVLARQAQEAGLFVNEADATSTAMPEGSLFLVRRLPGDWCHVGLVSEFSAETFATIEGNTNDDGSREGYEVCARRRAYPKRDFISFASLRKTRPAAEEGRAQLKLTVKPASKRVITKATIMPRQGDAAPVPIDLAGGSGQTLLLPEVAYLLRVQMTNGPAAGFRYSVDAQPSGPWRVVCPDGQFPARLRSRDGDETFSAVIELRPR